MAACLLDIVLFKHERSGSNVGDNMYDMAKFQPQPPSASIKYYDSQ